MQMIGLFIFLIRLWIVTYVNAKTYREGFLRCDYFLQANKKWLRFKAYSIGLCYRTDNGAPSSEMAASLSDDTGNFVRTVYHYATSDCSGKYSISKITDSKSLEGITSVSHQPFTLTCSYVKDSKAALSLYPEVSNGALWKTYLTDQGCSGNPGYYELINTDPYCGWDMWIYGKRACIGDNVIWTRFDEDSTCSTDGTFDFQQNSGCSDFSITGSPFFQTQNCVTSGKPKGKPKPFR